MEASGRLVGPPVFKTGERQILSLAGSIPVRLRQPFLRPPVITCNDASDIRDQAVPI